MSLFSRIHPRSWILLPVCAVGFLGWVNHGRMQRVEYVSSLAGRADAADARAAASPTGYGHEQRELIVPERSEESFHWIAQTQQMFARGEWRVHHVDYDNAPMGRAVNAGSPYRWWLGLVAGIDHAVSGRPLGLSVERAALWADPLLHGLLLIGATGFAAWRFGAFAAALLAIGLAGVFPLAAGFLPGVPTSHGLANACALGSILVLLAGLRDGPRADRWFALAGVMGGLGLWIDVAIQVPVLAGIMLGAPIAAWTTRGQAPQIAGEIKMPWRVWAFSGATTVLAAYLAEYFPAQLGGMHLEWIHPLYGLAWLGGGELLARSMDWIQGRKTSRRLTDAGLILFAVVAVASIPLVMQLTNSRGFLSADLASVRLTNQPGGVVSASFRTWLAHDGMTATVWATLLPLIVLGPAGWLLLSRTTQPESRASLAVAVGPVLVALGFACAQLSWWSMLDGALLVLLVAAMAERGARGLPSSRWLWAALAAFFVIPGTIQLRPQRSTGAAMPLTAQEAQELIERHLAHWLAKRTEETGLIVYAPPHQTTALCFYGGLRGLGSFAAENRDGFGATLFITAAITMEEVQELLQSRGVRYVVIPSWDPFFEESARLYLAKKFANHEGIFVRELRRWHLPLWLRPLPYQIPLIGGNEVQSVLVFEVVEEQSPAVAASRLAEYLVEVGKLDEAAAAGETLRRFPGDVGALAARAQVQNARGDAAGAAQTLAALRSRLAAGADRLLPWDRRVSVAIVLAQGEQIDLAREQVRRCLAELNENRLRALTAGLLYNLQVLCHAFDYPIADPKLRQLALELLPVELSSRL